MFARGDGPQGRGYKGYDPIAARARRSRPYHPRAYLGTISAGISLQPTSRRLDNPQTSMNTKINHLAVWILIVVYFLIGWGWYAIFGEKWLNLHARTMTDIEHTHNVGAYVLAFLASIAVNYTLAVLIA